MIFRYGNFASMSIPNPATHGATAMLAHFVADTARQPLPPEVARKAAFCLLDALGLGVLAQQEHTVLAINSLTAAASSIGRLEAGQARRWTDGARVNVADAVTANAVAVHAQFHDDTDYSSWTHPGSLIVSVALSLGESVDASVASVLRAIAIGYDAIEWLGARDEVARGMISRGIRCSPTLGTVAAAASASAILGQDAGCARSAIGIASSITGGVLEPVRCGSDEWRIQNAHAARGGLLAAQLAGKGVMGAPEGLEGPKGLLRALAGIEEIPAAWKELPRIDAILGVSAKPWATLGDNMSAVIAAGLVRAERNTPADIRSITIKIWRHFTEYPGTSYRGPYSRVPQALASMAFATAAMLVHGELEYGISLGHRENVDILRLVPLVEMLPDDDGTPYDATVTVLFEDGTKIVKEAREAGMSQLFHDASTATALFEDRLVRSGYAKGTGLRIAAMVMTAASDETDETGVRQFLDELLQTSQTPSRV
jgi:2-methylcitrate dehydratase PrpD